MEISCRIFPKAPVSPPPSTGYHPDCANNVVPGATPRPVTMRPVPRWDEKLAQEGGVNNSYHQLLITKKIVWSGLFCHLRSGSRIPASLPAFVCRIPAVFLSLLRFAGLFWLLRHGGGDV